MIKRLLIPFVLLAALSSCLNKDLCYRHPHYAAVKITADWTEFCKVEEPTGMTVMIYPPYGANPQTLRSNTITHVNTNLESGRYNTLVFNQSTSEFGSLVFRNMEDFNKAEVAAGPAPTKWYTTRTEEEKTAYQPEWFGTDCITGTEVTEEMITSNTDSAIELIHHIPENIIYTVNVAVKIKNIQNLKSARAALSGMAEGYMLGASRQTGTKATHLMEEWKMVKTNTDKNNGSIYASITCFGLPYGHKATPDENTLDLHLLLQDNKTQLHFPIDVGHLFKKDKNEQLTLYLEIELPEPLPNVTPQEGTSGGFDATVQDWGEDIEHNINI